MPEEEKLRPSEKQVDIRYIRPRKRCNSRRSTKEEAVIDNSRNEELTNQKKK